MLLSVILIAVIVGLDQWTKYLTVEHIKPIGTLPIIPDVFHLTYVENRGAAFSILQGKRLFFVLLTLAVVAVILVLLYRKAKGEPLLRVSLIMIAGGAIGNLIDRLVLGYVVDMVDLRIINYAIFNVADCFVVVGTILLAVYILFFDRVLLNDKKKEPNKQRETEEKDG